MAVVAAPATAQTQAPAEGSAATTESTEAQTAKTEPVDPAKSGGAEYGKTTGTRASRPAFPVVNGYRAKMLRDGTAAAPSMAPAEVQKAIWAANRIVGKPYRYGGGHGKWEDTGYDCSGTISYAIRGAGKRFLASPLDSGSFMRWGAKGVGRWMTVYTNPGHAFIVIAGLRLDTSAAGDPSGRKGPRWRPALRSTQGFVARHPAGL
jgi:cell wall-associated NlpC family hydrolase